MASVTLSCGLHGYFCRAGFSQPYVKTNGDLMWQIFRNIKSNISLKNISFSETKKFRKAQMCTNLTNRGAYTESEH